MTEHTEKKCAECGAVFVPSSSRSKYCPKCVAEVYRRQTAERARRWRERHRTENKINLSKEK
jgi:predicted RNA-binding Zn-ribbon protein involved in translation (DUF1610 family)